MPELNNSQRITMRLTIINVFCVVIFGQSIGFVIRMGLLRRSIVTASNDTNCLSS
jgi:hypothetical protein